MADEPFRRETVGEWLGHSFEWRIPVYQRHYAWDAGEESSPIHLFWTTVEQQTRARLENSPLLASHYLGAVLVENKTPFQSTGNTKFFDVVDGQQRLTTIQIAMLALIQTAGEHGCGSEIKNSLEEHVVADKANNRPRLLPTNFDKWQFNALLSSAYGLQMDFCSHNGAEENDNKSKIDSAFRFFKGKYGGLVNQTRQSAQATIRAVSKALTEGFDLVLIVLRKSDKAQEVFESLNNSAKPLTTFDLIRNNVFSRAASIRTGLDIELFNMPAWKMLEKPYWEERADNRRNNWATHIEAYVARMLVAQMRRGLGFDRNPIFTAYKEFSGKFPEDDSGIRKEITETVRYTGTYRYLHSKKEKNPVSAEGDFGIFHYEYWKNRDLYPVIFRIVDSNVSAEEKKRMLRLLESYVIRRGVCKLPSANYNKQAATICAALGNEPSYEALVRSLKASNRATYLFPNDKKVEKGCVNKKFYGSAFQRYVFEKIEKSMHEVGVERVVVEQGTLTIDHILPQGWEENLKWNQIVLGNDGSRDDAVALTVNSYLDTIGNLTIMSGKNNTAKSNQPFEKVKGLLAASELKLNRKLADEEAWNVEKIAARSRKLAEKICEIWPYDIA